MPVCNHHDVYLWPCAFLGGVAMFPKLHNQDIKGILQLPEDQRVQHLGPMVILLATMT